MADLMDKGFSNFINNRTNKKRYSQLVLSVWCLALLSLWFSPSVTANDDGAQLIRVCSLKHGVIYLAVPNKTNVDPRETQSSAFLSSIYDGCSCSLITEHTLLTTNPVVALVLSVFVYQRIPAVHDLSPSFYFSSNLPRAPPLMRRLDV